MKLAVWAHPSLEYPEGADSKHDIEVWLGKLREAGVSQYMPFSVTWYRASDRRIATSAGVKSAPQLLTIRYAAIVWFVSSSIGIWFRSS